MKRFASRLKRFASWLILDILYLSAFIISAPWLLWRLVRYGKNRRGWKHKLFGLVPQRTGDRPCVWFHAVSVGEVNLLSPVIDRLLKKIPEVQLVISTTTETGFELASKKMASGLAVGGGHQLIFFPFDFSWACRNSLRRVRPDLIVLAELEIWPNFISIAESFSDGVGSKEGMPVAVINGRLSESSFRGYQRLKSLLKPSFERLAWVGTQDQAYADRFLAMGCRQERVCVTGSVKYDGVNTDRKNPQSQQLRALAGIEPGDFVFLAGSTQVEEDRIAAKIFLDLKHRYPELKLILVPRHPERCDALTEELQEMGLEVIRRSMISPEYPARRPRNGNAIFLVDVIGELGGWWGVADGAYVGGSMGKRGGQNMIEPAAYGIPVSFGPNTRNFRATVDLLKNAQACVVVQDQEELQRFVERAINDPSWRNEIGTRAQGEVLRHAGAADRTVAGLQKLLELESSSSIVANPN